MEAPKAIMQTPIVNFKDAQLGDGSRISDIVGNVDRALSECGFMACSIWASPTN